MSQARAERTERVTGVGGVLSEIQGIACYVVDAFTRRAFRGNPAAVCPVSSFPSEALMRAIARENALSETAFFTPRPDGNFDLRWFTPEVEVDLCGHATLASAFVLMNVLEPGRDRVTWHTRSGPLVVVRDEDALVMDFPSSAPEPAPDVVRRRLAEAVGGAPAFAWWTGAKTASDGAELDVKGMRVVLGYRSAEEVRALAPDFTRLAHTGARGVMATAPGSGPDADVDFVSRYFAPLVGIAEDPVTGSAHCILAPLWSLRLGHDRLLARQVSARSGEITCTVRGERTELRGHAVLVKSGVLHAAALDAE